MVIGRARQEGRVLQGDNTVWQIHLDSGLWRQVMELLYVYCATVLTHIHVL